MITLGEVKSGLVDIVDILKINALLDLRSALERREHERARSQT